MDWFRWWNGSVTDPKFLWISREANTTLANVLAVWAAILEFASQSVDRGSFEGFCCMDYDLLLGLQDGTADAILAALESRGMVVDGFVVNWDKRQPMREDNSTDRVRRHRERKRNETQCNAPKRNETPRREEIREEYLNTFNRSFWPAYPRKTKRKDAEKAWVKLEPDENLISEILANIKARLNAGEWSEKAFIPHPATFLNGERWKDEVIPKHETRKQVSGQKDTFDLDARF